MRSEDQLAKDLGDHIKESLVAMWAARDLTTVPTDHLVFPKKRVKEGGKRKIVTRVSEQESKIVATQWLSCESHPFSIETPTMERFRFTPTGNDDETEPPNRVDASEGESDDGDGQSARTDITVYRHNGKDLQPFLNIELKALQPDWGKFRKDLEKLLRENVEGMWFHTLEAGRQDSWDGIGWKLWQAYEELEKGFEDLMNASSHSVRFRVIALKPTKRALVRPQEEEFKIRFAHWKDDLGGRFDREDVEPDP